MTNPRHIEEAVAVFNTGAAQKYLEALPVELPRLEKGADVAAAIGSRQSG